MMSLLTSSVSSLFLCLMILQPPQSTLFPYTDALPILNLGGCQQPPDVCVESKTGRTLLGVVAARAFEDAAAVVNDVRGYVRSEEHTSELQSQFHLVCRLLLEKKK